MRDQTTVLDSTGAPRIVVLVAHGLNQRSDAMRELYEPLRLQGACVVLARFRGHRAGAPADAATVEAWRTVEWGDWGDDWLAAARIAQQLAETHRVPLTFLGFSLGGLVHVHHLATGTGVPVFVRQVLLAPAIRVHPRSRAVRAFRALGRRFLVPSLAPEAVRSHGGTSVAAYEALFRYESALDVVPHPDRLRIPTLVVIDPRDELASAPRLVDWIAAHGLESSWHVHAIEKDMTTARSRLRHYVTDEAGLGPGPFAHLVDLLTRALFDGAMGPPSART